MFTAEEKQKEITASVQASIAELKEGRLALNKIIINGNVDEALLKERLEVLTALLADASLTQSVRDGLAKELNYATGLYSISTIISATKNAVAKADSLANREHLEPVEILMARNQLQTANTLLSQIWSSDCSKYLEFMTVAQKLQNEIAEIDKKLNIIASAPAKEEIEKLVAECKQIANLKRKKYTARINEITEKSKEFTHLLPAVYDIDLRKSLADEISSLTPIVTNLHKKRYGAYNEWAIEKLDKARKLYNDTSFITKGGEKAANIFYDYIVPIRLDLLISDVQTLYNSIYQLIYKKLNNPAFHQYRKAISKDVKTLEDF